jgi:tetratricopeptide (TPR) repeat protein
MKTLTAIIIMSATLIISCSEFEESDIGRFNYGINSLKKGEKSKAFEIFKSIDSLYPGSPYGEYGRAIAFSKEHLYYEAANAFYRTISKQIDFVPALYSFSELSTQLGWDEMAYDLAQKALSHDQDSLLCLKSLIDLAIDNGEIQKAGNLIETCHTIAPDDPELLMLTARYEFHMGRIDEGLKAGSRAVEISNRDKHILFQAGRLFSRLGMADSAAIFFYEAMNKGRRDYFFKADVIDALIDINYFISAREFLDDLYLDDEFLFRPFDLDIKMALKSDQPLLAEKIARRMIKKIDETPSVLMRFSEAGMAAGNILYATRYAHSASLLAENDSLSVNIREHINVRRMELLLEKGAWPGASSLIFENEDILNPNFRTLSVMTEIYFQANQLNVAGEYIALIQDKLAGYSNRHARMGQLFSIIDSLESAELFYDQALEIDKMNIDAIVGKMLVFKKRGQLDKALEFINNFDSRLHFNPGIFSELISIYKEIEDYQAGLDLAEKAISMGKMDMFRYRIAFDLASEAGDRDKQISIIGECLANNPESSDAALFAGRSYKILGEYESAEEQFSRALAIDTTSTLVLIELADFYNQLDRIDTAMVLYKKIIELDKIAGRAYGKLARLMVENDGDPNEFRNYISMAQKYDPHPDHHLTIGLSNYKRGEYKIAKTSFDRVLNEDPENPEYNFYAGMNYVKLNQEAEAKTHLNKAIENGLGDKLKAEAEKALSEL